VFAGIGDGSAIVCNALLVQRGAEDAMRGRALTLVMSATYVLTAVGSGLAGGLEHVGPRWVWGSAAVCFLVGGGVGWMLARDAGPVEVPLEATAH
jgi:MFS family permease